MMRTQHKIRVWDLPVRLVHWCLPVALIVLFVSAHDYAMELHAQVGQAVLVLVLFRVLWGFVGSQTARFGDFVVGPRSIVDYVAGGRPKSLGHNPVGALMVLSLLAFLLVLTVSGLFSDDGMSYRGPLANLISSTLADRIAEFHATAAYVFVSLVVAHVFATLWHFLHRNENLILPMVSGRKAVDSDVRPPKFARLPLACGVFVVSVGVVALLSFGL